jgi:hypothetical protein
VREESAGAVSTTEGENRAYRLISESGVEMVSAMRVGARKLVVSRVEFWWDYRGEASS